LRWERSKVCFRECFDKRAAGKRGFGNV